MHIADKKFFSSFSPPPFSRYIMVILMQQILSIFSLNVKTVASNLMTTTFNTTLVNKPRNIKSDLAKILLHAAILKYA